MTEDREYWSCVIAALQEVMTIAAIAEEVGANDRQVWRWKAGQDKPMGLKAIRLYRLHVKRCPEGQCPLRHVAEVK